MTWHRVQKLTEALLSGDHVLAKDAEGRLALLAYAFEDIANSAEATLLITDLDVNGDRVRMSYNDRYVRRPRLPENDGDELEIDEGLCFAVARFIASYVSKDKTAMHIAIGKELVMNYNAKVASYMELQDDE